MLRGQPAREPRTIIISPATRQPVLPSLLHLLRTENLAIDHQFPELFNVHRLAPVKQIVLFSLQRTACVI